MAFEVVTAVLGDHGEILHRDFIILTAVADRFKEYMHSTTEVIDFAHKFRLPHNDSWIFTSQESADALFRLYDTSRETGTAKDTIDALNNIAEAHVPSMYPHLDFPHQLQVR